MALRKASVLKKILLVQLLDDRVLFEVYRVMYNLCTDLCQVPLACTSIAYAMITMTLFENI